MIKHLTTSNVTTARVMSHWKTLFGLKCESCDDFLSFYSKAKGVLHKLKKHDSVAVTDDIFLKAYFSMTIEAPELQTEVKRFLKDTDSLYSEILEIIHADYRAQTTGKDIIGASGVNTTTSPLSRRTTVEATKSKRDSEVEKVWAYAPFPDNIGQLISSELYSQVKRCYAVLSKPPSACTTSDKPFVTNFRFNCKRRIP